MAIVAVFYVAISTVVVGHLGFPAIARHSDYALSAAANVFAGRWGGVLIVITALLATSSAINATFYGAGRLTYLIAKSGELPAELERSIRDQPLEGMILFAALTLLAANTLPLGAIATMGSAGFLLIFLAVNIANVKLAKETESPRWISAAAAASCVVALVALCGQTLLDPATRWHIWILAGMVVFAYAIEALYRARTGRSIELRQSTPRSRRP